MERNLSTNERLQEDGHGYNNDNNKLAADLVAILNKSYSQMEIWGPNFLAHNSEGIRLRWVFLTSFMHDVIDIGGRKVDMKILDSTNMEFEGEHWVNILKEDMADLVSGIVNKLI